MKSFEQQLEDLKKFYPLAQKALEGGVEFILLPELVLPPNCKPEKIDALLCPVLRDGYHTRLFYSQLISGIPPKNWNGKNIYAIVIGLHIRGHLKKVWNYCKWLDIIYTH